MDFPQRDQYETLSERELTVLRLLADGLSDREIADKLVMTINTIKWYNRQIYSILGVSSRTQAVARAHELRLFRQPEQATAVPSLMPTLPLHNLAAESTRFIGRQHETAEVKQMLATHRLITLTGAPGTGKTRLSLHVAHDVFKEFHDGVYFVSLAPINGAARVIHTLASTIGVNEVYGQPILETLKHLLRDKHLLLVMDNFEHVLEAASYLSELLASAVNLKILATSREALHIYGEHEYSVPLMELPDPDRNDPDVLASCESVTLFVERAHAIQPEFALTPENALTIAKICVQLEGLPLAIELAAARIKLLPPTALLARLGSRLDLLTHGPRDLPARQQTLRRTIDWSYDLLDTEEKKLFARLAVFRGSRSLESMELVCCPGLAIEPLEGIESLVNKSLLFPLAATKDGEPRFLMLETIHEYAWEQLEAIGDVNLLRRRHAIYFTELAERAEPELRSAGFAHWMARLEIEHGNLETALQWAFTGGDTELGLRLVATLRDFWSMSSRFVDGERWVRIALPHAPHSTPDIHARVLITARLLYFFSNRQLPGRDLLEDAVAIARATNNQPTLAWALTFLGTTAIARRLGREASLAAVEEGLVIFRKLGHKSGIAQALNIIGELTRTHGDDERAQTAYEECLQVVRETGEVRRETMILNNLSFIATHRNALDKAEHLIQQALAKSLEVEYDTHLIVSTAVSVANIAGLRGDVARATRLFGAAEALFEPMGVSLMPGDLPEYERSLKLIRSKLDEVTFRQYWNEGRQMPLEQMVACAQERTSEI